MPPAQPVTVMPEPTSNPNAYKFTLNCPVLSSGTKTYADPKSAAESPLARALFAVGGIENVSMNSNYITVMKKSETDWQDILLPVEKAILENVKA
jgi:NFU1 iron-sulfur cluster scaffold homolog, mitochondrial